MYDIGDLSPDSQRNAASGIRDVKISMVRCYEELEQDPDKIFHFELQERIRVTIASDRSSCSMCNKGKVQVRPCKHVWWLDNQILGSHVSGDGGQLQISPDARAYRVRGSADHMTFHDLIDKMNLDAVAKKKGWWVQDPEDDDDAEVINDTVMEVLSAFEPRDLFWSHGQSNSAELQQRTQ